MEYTKSHTYKTSSCKLSKMNMCSHAQSHVSLHVWYMLSHAAFSTSRGAFVYYFVYYCYTVLYSIAVSLFQAQNVWKQGQKQQ